MKSCLNLVLSLVVVLMAISTLQVHSQEQEDEYGYPQFNNNCLELFQKVFELISSDGNCPLPMFSTELQSLTNLTNLNDIFTSAECIWNGIQDTPIISNLLTKCKETNPDSSSSEIFYGVKLLLCVSQEIVAECY